MDTSKYEAAIDICVGGVMYKVGQSLADAPDDSVAAMLRFGQAVEAKKARKTKQAEPAITKGDE